MRAAGSWCCTGDMVSAQTGGAVAAFVYIESNKDVLFKYVHFAGFASVLFTLIFFFLPASSIVLLVGATATAVSGGIGWYTSLNKKDDLNMMRAVAKFEEQLERLKAAEQKLDAALSTMTVAGADIDELNEEISKEQDATEATIRSIQKINGEAMDADKRSAHEKILVTLADIDGNRTFEVAECERLIRLLCNMSGKDPDDPIIEETRTKMPPLNEPGKSMTSKQMHTLLNDIDAFDIIMTPPEDFFKDQGFKSRNESKRRLTIPASLDDASAVSGGPSEPAEDAQ